MTGRRVAVESAALYGCKIIAAPPVARHGLVQLVVHEADIQAWDLLTPQNVQDSNWPIQSFNSFTSNCLWGVGARRDSMEVDSGREAHHLNSLSPGRPGGHLLQKLAIFLAIFQK